MKKVIAALVGFGIAAAAHAGVLTHTFDISGLDSEGGFGANFPTLTHDFGVPGTIIGVEWDVNYTANSPSWASEVFIAIDTNDDFSNDADLDPVDYGAPDASGPFAYSGSVMANSVSSDGLVFLTLWDGFSDAPVPDATYGGNSWVTVIYQPVPAPGAAALLGLGGLVAMRRRR